VAAEDNIDGFVVWAVVVVWVAGVINDGDIFRSFQFSVKKFNFE